MTSVLVVDDRGVQRELLAAVLGPAGYDVRKESTGEQALTTARKDPLDLIISGSLMRDYGVDFVQGYHLARPGPMASDNGNQTLASVVGAGEPPRQSANAA